MTAETVFMGSPTVSHNAGLTTPFKGQALLRFCSSLQMICHSVLSLFASKKKKKYHPCSFFSEAFPQLFTCPVLSVVTFLKIQDGAVGLQKPRDL